LQPIFSYDKILMQVKYCLWLNKPLSGLRHAGGRALEVGTPSDWNVSGKRRR
jgi:hypothetical protein